jgi:tetratricopeptide (TPR) repeat protein
VDGSTWEERIAAFWADADDERPVQMWTALEALLAERPEGDAVAAFERASLHDMLGEEERAVPLYQQAITAGLDDERAGFAVIQLGSTLRNVGRLDEAADLLQTRIHDEQLGAAARSFLALTRHDQGRHAEALRLVLTDHAPHVPLYGRALAEYAGLLTD